MLQLTLTYWRRQLSLVQKLLRPWTWFRRPKAIGRSIAEHILRPEPETDFNGTGSEVLLQGFHWESCNGSTHDGKKKSWYAIVSEHASAIKSASFDAVWFPPPSDSLSPAQPWP